MLPIVIMNIIDHKYDYYNSKAYLTKLFNYYYHDNDM